MKAEGLDFYYGSFQALKNINLDIKEKQITALIGPSGCGKSTFLRTLNRMNDLIPQARVTGSVFLDGENIYDPGVNPVNLRQKVGMVFQRPNPFPKSIFNNVASGPIVLGQKKIFTCLKPLKKASKAPPCGMKFRIVFTTRPFRCPVGSSNVCVLPAYWQSIPK